MDRRRFLQATALPLATGSATLMAAPAAGSRLLVVFLRGGYDAANLLVPVGSRFYYEARPNIAIARPSADAASALAVDADWGLHPALRDTLGPLLARRELAFVPFAGTEDLSRSHFETQDSIELGQPLGGTRNFRSGFMNRLATVLQGSAPIAFTQQLPLAFQGAQSVPNLALSSLGRGGLDKRQGSIVSSMYQGTALAAPVQEGLALREDLQRRFATEMDAASRNAVNARGFELEAQRIARLMRETYTLGFIDIGGWDTHVGQGGATGYLAGRFEELGRGLAAFAAGMGAQWRDTTVVVLSEFGRTFRENGNRGTDHGHGSVIWVLGGATKAQSVAGAQVRLEAGTLNQNRDWPVLNDYRAVIGGLLAGQFGLSEEALRQVFPGVAPLRLGLA